MSKLHRISPKRSTPALGSVVFVHGLGGDAYATWRHGKDHELFWPKWLADDFPQFDIYSLAYDAAPTAWLGATMPIFDRAKQVLTWLEPLANKPIVFICHSLGGLLVKQMIRTASTSGFDNWRPLANQTKGVVFLGTPHTGADLAGTLNRLGTILGTTVSITELAKNNTSLLDINEWYRNNSATQLKIKTLPFYESQKTHGFLVVDQSAADPTIQGIAAIPAEGSHITMCKPESRDEFLYVTIERFVRGCFSAELNKHHSITSDGRSGSIDFKPKQTSLPSLPTEAMAWLLAIKNYPAVKPYEIPYEVIQSFAQSFPTMTSAKAFINSVSALRAKLNPENNTEQQILVRPQDLPIAPASPIDFWTEVLTLAGGKSRRTLATFTVAPNAPTPELYGSEAVQAFFEFKTILENSPE